MAVAEREGVAARAVDDLLDVPNRYLRLLPVRNLQSLSVAVGQAGQGLTDRFLRFAEACGACGVTAVHTVGRGAFPQLAYSWDGLIPLDMVRRRPAGRFTTVEFDAPFQQMIETYHMFLERGADLGMTGAGARPGRFAGRVTRYGRADGLIARPEAESVEAKVALETVQGG